MQPHGLYNLHVETQTSLRKRGRVGLLHSRTGMPAFLIYLKGIEAPKTFEFHSQEDVESELLQTSENFNKVAWQQVIAFFQAEGKNAHVVAVPYSQSNKPLENFIGSDKGLHSRTGLYAIKAFEGYADLAVIPQAVQILGATDYRKFLAAAFSLLQNSESIFLIVDAPKKLTSKPFFKSLFFDSAAAFSPWLLSNNQIIPPSPVVAASIQNNDALHGIQDAPANRVLSGKFLPMMEFSPWEVRASLEERVNTIQHFSDRNLKIWGNLTLTDTLNHEAKFISTRRTLLALREAIHQICEPYVMEPITSALPQEVEIALHSFFHSVKNVFDPNAKEPFTVEVKIKKEKEPDTLEIRVGFALPYAVDQLSLELDLTG